VNACHLLLTLRLNFRAAQPILYGYLVPIFFLAAFAGVFASPANEMGQLLTITVLGGACFGMPTAIVAERERGVWRRYRLLPAATASLILSVMTARYLLVLSAAAIQIVLARCIYGAPFPAHPFELAVAFTLVCFAFLGMGLIIAMAADTVPAVQALGQAIFLPMILIGGVGVPLRALPPWAWHAASFFPGRYAVDAMQACIRGGGLAAARFDLVALTVIGAAACACGAMIFRWDSEQKLTGRAKLWAFASLLAWAAVGLAAGPITEADLHSISFENLPDDNGVVAPFAAGLDNLDATSVGRLATIQKKLDDWKPDREKEIIQRVRNDLCVCAIPDLMEDPLEAEIPYVVFERLKRETPREELRKALGWIILHPDGGSIVASIPDLGQAKPEKVRERSVLYAKKFLLRLM